MSNHEQPLALRLAASAHLGYRVGWQREAAAELRRQNAVIAELADSVQVAIDSDLGRLWAWPDSSKETWMENARAALARAKEQR